MRIGGVFSLSAWKSVSVTSIYGTHISKPSSLTGHHREFADVVFKSRNSEAIADLLFAWTKIFEPARALLWICTEYLINLHDLVPFSSRLWRLVIRSVELIGYKGFEGAGVKGFIKLLNHLHVTTEDMDWELDWTVPLLDILRTFEGAHHLSHWYWELLVELATSEPLLLRDKLAYSPQTTTFLIEAQEWSRLECWVGIVWMVWPPEADGTTEEDLNRPTLLLFQQQRGATQKLEQSMERWSRYNDEDVPESFQWICKQAHEAAQRDAPQVPFPAHLVCLGSHAGFYFVPG